MAKTVTMDILKDEKNPSSQAEIKFVNNKITETLEESEENKANTNYNNTEYMKYSGEQHILLPTKSIWL